MFVVIGIMFLGVALGFLFKNVQWLQNISKSITVTIFLLLFFLGTEIGSNKEIISNLPTLGWQAAIFAIAGSLGSAVAALIIYKLFFKNKEAGNER